jgi:hypothetical protein
MNHHDFTEFYLMSGHLMESNIKELLKTGFGDGSPVKCEPIEFCIKYLQSIDDELFESIYLSIPSNIEMYDTNVNEMYDANEDLTYNDEDYNYYYYEYAHAFISNINLIQRCLKISMIPLNNILRDLVRYERGVHCTYTHFDIESCKLLCNAGCNTTHLLSVACYMEDYNSIAYLINGMSVYELYDLICSGEFGFFNLTNILVVDRIYNMKDKCLIESLKSIISSNDIHIDDRIMDNLLIYLRCYIIIKYMDIDEAKLLMTHINNLYISQIKEAKNNTYWFTGGSIIFTSKARVDRHIYVDPPVNQYGSSTFINDQLLHNNLLEYHFRPRGSHTKGATHSAF